MSSVAGAGRVGLAITPSPPTERQRDPERTRAEILDVATHEFALHGYSGARVDDIAARTRTTKRMLYYYFGSKEQLYIAVLERAYAQIRDAEQTLDVEHLDPKSAIRQLAELTFDHHEAHPDFIRLVSIENIDQAEHIVKSAVLGSLNTRVVDLTARILETGYRQGVFCRDVDPLDLHMLISAYCVFRVANRYTFRAIFKRDLVDRARRQHFRRMLGDVVVAYLTSPPEPESPVPTRSARRSPSRVS
jgi:AcrR family transcriptional regulator